MMNEDTGDDRVEKPGPVARHLDGRRVRLNDPQAKVARDVREHEAWLGGMLDVSMPPEVLEKVYQRLDGALARGRRGQSRQWPIWRLATIGAVAAAVALVIVLNALVVDPIKPIPPSVALSAEEVVDQFLTAGDATALDAELSLLDDEVTLAWAELVFNDEFGDADPVETMDAELDSMWLIDVSEIPDEFEL